MAHALPPTLSIYPGAASFAALLDWHLKRGTRPKGNPDTLGKQWTNKDFAGCAGGTKERNVRNWRTGRNRPPELISIERELFGDNEIYTTWRADLRDAYLAAERGVSSDSGTAFAAADGTSGLPVDRAPVGFSAKAVAVSNITIRVPEHFMGRAEALAAIETALQRDKRCAVVTALHGLRGVGKTVLAIAYAVEHRSEYRATWWIGAQTESTVRAALVGLGVKLGWVKGAEEDPALNMVMERLRDEGEGILLIFDNAAEAHTVRPYLPLSGAARVIITSNSHAWRGIAEPVEVRVWPKDIGTDFLIARSGTKEERVAAEELSEALEGLPLAHEQAGAYCEHLGVSLAEYRRRFRAAPMPLLDDERHAPVEYGRTVARTFKLAIDALSEHHSAAEPLLLYAAMLAPVSIPLFVFSEAREKFGEPLASLLTDVGLNEAVAALRSFALVERETIADEREPTILTDTIRLHRLVREVAADRLSGQARQDAQCALVNLLAAVYPIQVDRIPSTWPRARRLDALALALVGGDAALPNGVEEEAIHLLHGLAGYRHDVLATYDQARPLYERCVAIREIVHGPEHPLTALSRCNLAVLLKDQGDLDGARALTECALEIFERTFGPEASETALGLNQLGCLLEAQGDFVGARTLLERALAIREKVLPPDDLMTAESANNLGLLLHTLGDFTGARPLLERALAIWEKLLDADDPQIALGVHNLGSLLESQRDFAGARRHLERALAIWEKALGPEHRDTARGLSSLAHLSWEEGDPTVARSLYERALSIYEKVLGPEHSETALCLDNLGRMLRDQGDLAVALSLYKRALAIREKVCGPEHPDTVSSLDNLAEVLEEMGDLAEARPLLERVLAILEKLFGSEHPNTASSLDNLAERLRAMGDLAGARALRERALAIYEKVYGPESLQTATSLNHVAYLCQDQGDLTGARSLLERSLAIYEKVHGSDHRDIGANLTNLADVVGQQGDREGARELYERALKILQDVLGHYDPETESVYRRLLLLLAGSAFSSPRPTREF